MGAPTQEVPVSPNRSNGLADPRRGKEGSFPVLRAFPPKAVGAPKFFQNFFLLTRKTQKFCRGNLGGKKKGGAFLKKTRRGFSIRKKPPKNARCFPN